MLVEVLFRSASVKFGAQIIWVVPVSLLVSWIENLPNGNLLRPWRRSRIPIKLIGEKCSDSIVAAQDRQLSSVMHGAGFSRLLLSHTLDVGKRR
jgi:hypothetical protein